MKLTLAQWDVTMGQHLHGIQDGANKIDRHVNQMMFRPNFDTLAFDDIKKAEALLEAALRTVRFAKEKYLGKETVA